MIFVNVKSEEASREILREAAQKLLLKLSSKSHE